MTEAAPAREYPRRVQLLETIERHRELIDSSAQPVPGVPPIGSVARQVNRHGRQMQPMAGERQKLIGKEFETVSFANRRKKNRRRRELAKDSRRKNR
jgi:hypothetical protein